MLDRSTTDVLRKLINQETMWLRHYTGQVVDVVDPLNKGRVKVVVFDLSLDKDGGGTPDKGFWCWARDKNSITLPAVKDWVEVYFWNGDRDKPVYLGVANEIANMLPKNFDGKASTHVIFEDPAANKVHIAFDALKNLLVIGNQNFKKAARIDDATLSNASLDSAYWTFFTALKLYLDLHTHSGVTAGSGNSGIPNSVCPAVPTSLTGKVNAGSAQVQIGDA